MTLDTAIAAARATADEAAAQNSGEATRLRIRETLRRPRRRRSPWLAVIVATLFGSTAFAYFAIQRVSRGERPVASAKPVRGAPSHSHGIAVAPREITPATAPAGSAAVAPPEIASSPVPAGSAAVAPPAAAHGVAAPLHAVTVAAATPARSAKPEPSSPPIADPVAASPAAAPNAELAAYRTAHEAHFHSNDARFALAAWDRYLAAYPTGSFAIEARFNRALALIKLQRFADARIALAPFAAAPAGSYHQADAARLLHALP